MMTYNEFHIKYGRLPTERDQDYIRELERARAMSKIQILAEPILAPGRCAVCLSNKLADRKYVDIGVDLDDPFGEERMRGTVYICTTCVLSIVKELKKAIPGILDGLLESKSEPQIDYEALNKIKEELLAGLRDLGGSVPASESGDERVSDNSPDNKFESDGAGPMATKHGPAEQTSSGKLAGSSSTTGTKSKSGSTK